MSLGPSPRGVLAFALRTLGFGVVLFVLWYGGHEPVTALTARAAAALASLPSPVERVNARPEGRTVAFEVEPDYETSRRGRLGPGAVLEISANPLKYTFGLPLFLALLLASRPAGLAWKALAGSAVLVALAAVGLSCELLVQAGSVQGFGDGPLIRLQGREFIALGFQMGTLLFPTLVPAMLWAAMDPDSLRRLGGIETGAVVPVSIWRLPPIRSGSATWRTRDRTGTPGSRAE